jgi:hypothetical protein
MVAGGGLNVPKLNAVLMVVLPAALIGALGWLVLREPSPPAAGPELTRLLRKLADSDPDLRREAEQEFRRLGARGVDALREAAKSADLALAGRAARLVRELEAPAAPREAPETVEVQETVVFEIQGGGLRYYVRLVNRGTQPLVLAREAGKGYTPYARFESVDEKGSAEPIEMEAAFADAARLVVRPGETFDLFAGQSDGRVGLVRAPPGKGKLRFVWDASEGSAYRAAVMTSTEGVPLPPQRLASNLLP